MTADRLEHTCVFGLLWGDEGKGKVVDLLCPEFEVVVRYNGGANAGHTVLVGSEKFALHLLPIGVLHSRVQAVIGPGVVVDPITLLKEIDDLAGRGIDVSGKLKISDRAHLVMAWHKLEDRLSEARASEQSRIGTTSRGIGPCYADKMRRTSAIRFADLLYEEDLEQRVRRIAADRNAVLAALHGSKELIDIERVLGELDQARRLIPSVCDTTAWLHEAMSAGQRVLFEGANGILLDIDHGTYPFVTSSSTGPHGLGPGAGVPPGRVARLIGITKAYATRVGSGPFVSELADETGDRIRKQGNEFGTTTGRPRRCGWFDAVACRYGIQLSGATDVALMHLDTLSGFERIGVCVAYRAAGKTLASPPAHTRLLEEAEPVFEYLPGWGEEIRGVRRFEALPTNARAYVERIESLIGAPVSLIGVGPERSQVLLRGSLAGRVAVPEVADV